MIVFLLSGLWHGAQWSFLVWGGLNGLYQIIEAVLKPLRKKENPTFSRKLLHMMITFCLVDLSWVFFRADTFAQGMDIIVRMFKAKNSWILFDDSLFNLGLDWKNFLVMLMAIAVLVMVDFFKYRGISLRMALCRQEIWFRWLVLISGVLAVLVFGIWGSGYDEASFIYFQF